MRLAQPNTARFPEVTLYAYPTDARGLVIGGLEASAFQVRENGTPAQILRVENVGGSIDVCLALDRSPSMLDDGKLEYAKAAAREFINQLRPQDRAALITFASGNTLDQGLTSDLVRQNLVGVSTLQRQSGRVPRCGLCEPPATESRLGRSAAPRPGREPAQSQACRVHAAIGTKPQRHRRGGQREGIGRAVADLVVGRGRPRREGHLNRQDHLAGLKDRLQIRAITGEPIEPFDGPAQAQAGGPLRLDLGVKRHQRHREIAGVVRDAGRTRPQHRETPAVAPDGPATRAGLPLVAGRGGVSEVGATRPLEQVAPDRGHVADLRARRLKERLGHHGNSRGY